MAGALETRRVSITVRCVPEEAGLPTRSARAGRVAGDRTDQGLAVRQPLILAHSLTLTLRTLLFYRNTTPNDARQKSRSPNPSSGSESASFKSLVTFRKYRSSPRRPT